MQGAIDFVFIFIDYCNIVIVAAIAKGGFFIAY